MKDSISKQLTDVYSRYGWLINSSVKNMRLVLLILFAGLAGYLVFRIDSLVNSEISTPADTDAAVSKTVDESVLSIFRELYVQDVRLDSNFEEDRQNPF